MKNIEADGKPSSKFPPVGEKHKVTTTRDIQNINNNFWNEQSVDLHLCYKKGTAYANNSNKKSSINLITELLELLKHQYKESTTQPDIIDIVFNNIKNDMTILEKITDDVDKNCILATIQGYTLGCLKKYE